VSVTGWLVSYFARWLPHASTPGLYKVGGPGPDSPVIVTCNFSLTIKRLKKALHGLDVWLLSANSDGINVWCAAGGGILTEQRVIDAIKTSGLAEKVSHKKIILPQLSAPGVDRRAVEKETGFKAKFGPVHAEDIPEYLEGGDRKTPEMRHFRFDLRHRMDMLVSMNFPVFLLPAVVLAIFWPQYLAGFSAIFWCGAIVLYGLVNYIPGKSGWTQVLVTSAVALAVWAGVDWYLFADPLAHWGWLVATPIILMAVGLDLAGIATPRKSDPEQLLLKLGLENFGSVFSVKEYGKLHLDREKCKGCLSCLDVCPVGVYEGLGDDKKIAFADKDACFSCTACVKQCPEDALSLE